MHIRYLRIENFRAIRFLELKDLPNSILISGPNGCGKSSIFHAIRLLKSSYGEYHKNEYENFWQKFGIRYEDIPQEGYRIFYDPTKPIYIQADFKLTEEERTYLQENGYNIILQELWKKWGITIVDGETIYMNPATRQEKETDIKVQAEEYKKVFDDDLKNEKHTALIIIEPGNRPKFEFSPVIQRVFNQYEPDNLGVIDYNSSNRNYSRQKINGVNWQKKPELNQQFAQRALTNTNDKYNGVKGELAASYIQEIIAEKAGSPITKNNLNQTLKELFEVFLPDKTFEGVKPTETGELTFPVKLKNGQEHDIDELSSGEKEVIFGYLRLRNNPFKHSIILIDEPELHLNPRLTKGFPGFYQKHIGQTYNNQLWLTSHSDALLRETVENSDYVVYHLQPAYLSANNENQASIINVSNQLQKAIIDLMGDLGTYNPRYHVVFVEGKDQGSFDIYMISQLFPSFAEKVNLVSGGNKDGVKKLQVSFNEAAKNGKIDAHFYSIVDKDTEQYQWVEKSHQYSWDVYHIENYLIEPKYILKVINAIAPGFVITESEINDKLRECAKSLVNQLIRIEIHDLVDKKIQNCIHLGFDPNMDLVNGFSESIQRTFDHFDNVRQQLISKELSIEIQKLKEEKQISLKNNTWKKVFQARSILEKFVGDINQEFRSQQLSKSQINYETFRNLIINEMTRDKYKPEGMKKIIEKILS
ncbi:MAG: AAA family ATPase [Crocosphaera sp.]